MGWTYFPKPQGLTTIETIRQELSGPEGCPVVVDAIVNGTYYAAMRSARVSGAVVAIVCLIQDAGREIGLKFMDEGMGPRYHDAPAAVLAALTPTTSEWALNWRAACGMPTAGHVAQASLS